MLSPWIQCFMSHGRLARDVAVLYLRSNYDKSRCVLSDIWRCVYVMCNCFNLYYVIKLMSNLYWFVDAIWKTLKFKSGQRRNLCDQLGDHTSWSAVFLACPLPQASAWCSTHPCTRWRHRIEYYISPHFACSLIVMNFIVFATRWVKFKWFAVVADCAVCFILMLRLGFNLCCVLFVSGKNKSQGSEFMLSKHSNESRKYSLTL